jgi:hypothetical protein
MRVSGMASAGIRAAYLMRKEVSVFQEKAASMTGKADAAKRGRRGALRHMFPIVKPF